MKRFTKKEDKFLAENYCNLTLAELGEAMNRALGSVAGRLTRLNLIVPTEILKERRQRGIDKGWELRKYTCFPKGHEPWNKGLKGVFHGTVETQFKKGNEPHNIRHDGAISIRKDNGGRSYKYIRVKKGKWDLLHRVVWEKAHGKLPKGAVVKFIDGNTMNCTLENLRLTNRSGNMIDNTIHRYPTELVSTIKLLSKLNRTIKKQEL